jgi:hypothetical protein
VFSIASAILLGVFAPASQAASVVAIDFDGDSTSSGPVTALGWEGTADGYLGSGMRVSIAPGSHWGLTRFEAVPGRPDEAWFRYMLRLDDWQASQAGKLPGLVGLASPSGRGCIRPNADEPGWSARMMYRAVGTAGAPAGRTRIGYYVYHLDQPRDCGQIMEWNGDADLAQNQWYCIEGHVKLNTPGANDGVLDGWVDGAPAFTRVDLRFRDTAALHVDDFWMNIYSGGKAPSPERLDLTLDEVVVSAVGRVGCPDAFVDDEADPNEVAINQLAGSGAIEACRGRLVCPAQPITRGEVAAMLVRSLGTPVAPGPTSEERYAAELAAAQQAGFITPCPEPAPCIDGALSRGEFAGVLARAFALDDPGFGPFTDTSESEYASVVDALAAAGVTAGCGPDRFCPDLLVTRSDAAAMLARALDSERLVADPGPAARFRPGPLATETAHRVRGAESAVFDLIHGR